MQVFVEVIAVNRVHINDRNSQDSSLNDSIDGDDQDMHILDPDNIDGWVIPNESKADLCIDFLTGEMAENPFQYAP